MKDLIKNIIITGFVFLGFLIVFPGIIFASTNSSGAASQECSSLGVLGGQNASCTSSSSSTLLGIVKTALGVLSYVIGVVSVIMIIYAGFRYVISGGESGNVTNAKNTLLYAIIGLVLVVIAQIIVNTVLNSVP